MRLFLHIPYPADLPPAGPYDRMIAGYMVL